MKNRFVLFGLFLSFLMISALGQLSHAQDVQMQGFSAGNTIQFETELLHGPEEELDPEQEKKILERSKNAEGTFVKDEHADKYVAASVENIAKLLWKKRILDIENDVHIDNFLVINECDIFQKFYNDDFEWVRVRKAARDMIASQVEYFPEHLKVLVPIDFGRYDQERKGFPLIGKTAFKDLRRVEIGGNSAIEKICGFEGNLQGYPRNIVLILRYPFFFDFVELDEHVAQAYIVRQKYAKIKRPNNLIGVNFNRLAYARMRVSFDKYQGQGVGPQGQPVALMFGKLDGIDVFEDPYEKRMLTSIDFD